MRPLTAHDLLRVWERGETEHPLDRALTLLAPACPKLTRKQLASLSIGQRDALLLALREKTFGQKLQASADCPQCRKRLEFALDVADFQIPSADEQPQYSEFTFTAEGLSIRARFPNSMDLASVARQQDVSRARRILARRCVIELHDGDREFDSEELPEIVISALSAEIAGREPLFEIELDLRCAECGHGWFAVFDIVAFLWAEISASAQRLLGEIHALARAYGWSEAETLALSARRRQLYIQMVT